ncbi:hypothetical protein J437_LFUL018449 [Ladona fulva]|uniref:Uncharacterized protein n=1 Tax=Ladona fulva TaxID=123851 RepID=A0A8K0KUU3_LADFU|nr:hypothetical protein J437_LFUL018449 [Ladona fulva]
MGSTGERVQSRFSCFLVHITNTVYLSTNLYLTLNCINDVTEGKGSVRLGRGWRKVESLMLRDIPLRNSTASGPFSPCSLPSALPPSCLPSPRLSSLPDIVKCDNGKEFVNNITDNLKNVWLKSKSVLG